MNLGIVGAGYVGLTTAICLSSLNHKVTIYDIDKGKIEQIQNKQMPFFENGLQNLLEKTINSRSLNITNDMNELVKDCDVCFICVGTPSSPDGCIDLSQILSTSESLAKAVKRNSKKDFVIVIRSTVVPKTTRNKVLPILQQILDKQEFGLCVVPEFLREGQALNDFMNPDKIVIGGFNEKYIDLIAKIFEYFLTKSKIIKTNPETAELIKYTNNAFFSLLISFANEIANISEKITGVDSFEVMNALISDKRITTKINDQSIIPELISYLMPGCGFGGSCFPKDVRAILKYSNINQIKTPLLQAILDINDERPQKIVSMAESILGDLKNKKISILGLTFKPDTDDMRSSPALATIEILKNKGASMIAFDPIISKKKETSIFDINLAKSIDLCLEQSNLAILFTKWPEFRSIDGVLLQKHMRNPVIIDGRGFLDQSKFTKNTYYKIGLTG